MVVRMASQDTVGYLPFGHICFLLLQLCVLFRSFSQVGREGSFRGFHDTHQRGKGHQCTVFSGSDKINELLWQGMLGVHG